MVSKHLKATVSRIGKFFPVVLMIGLFFWFVYGDIGYPPNPNLRVYSSGGITFEYLEDWRITGDEQAPGIHLITLEGGRHGMIAIDTWPSSDDPKDKARAALYRKSADSRKVLPQPNRLEWLRDKISNWVDGVQPDRTLVIVEKVCPGSENWFCVTSPMEDLSENRKTLDIIVNSYRNERVSPGD